MTENPRLDRPADAERVMVETQVVDAVYCPGASCKAMTAAGVGEPSIAAVVRYGRTRRALCPVCMGAYPLETNGRFRYFD